MPRKPTWPRACRCCDTADTRELVKNASKPGGFDLLCRSCQSDEWKLRRKPPEMIERRRETSRRWNEANNEQLREKRAELSRHKWANRDPVAQAIGQAVKAWRAQHGLTQAGLAKLLGISAATLNAYEGGADRWPEKHLAKLARAGVPMPEEVRHG